MPHWLSICLIILAIAVALFALDRLALWMERRGWIYWRKVKPKGGGIAAGLTAFHELVEPQVRQVIEEREEHSARQQREDDGRSDDDSKEPPTLEASDQARTRFGIETV